MDQSENNNTRSLNGSKSIDGRGPKLQHTFSRIRYVMDDQLFVKCGLSADKQKKALKKS